MNTKIYALGLISTSLFLSACVLTEYNFVAPRPDYKISDDWVKSDLTVRQFDRDFKNCNGYEVDRLYRTVSSPVTGIQIAENMRQGTNWSAYETANAQWQRCLMEKGYRYDGTCPNPTIGINLRDPVCKGS
jgi:hypothetical protein